MQNLQWHLLPLGARGQMLSVHQLCLLSKTHLVRTTLAGCVLGLALYLMPVSPLVKWGIMLMRSLRAGGRGRCELGWETGRKHYTDVINTLCKASPRPLGLGFSIQEAGVRVL